jgi:hypothetical protein
VRQHRRCPLSWGDGGVLRFRRLVREDTLQVRLLQLGEDARIVQRPEPRVAGRTGPGYGA